MIFDKRRLKNSLKRWEFSPKVAFIDLNSYIWFVFFILDAVMCFTEI